MISLAGPETSVAATPLTFVATARYSEGAWSAVSNQLPGWTAVADSADELYDLVRESPAVYLGWPEGGYTVVLVRAEWPLTYEEA